MATTLTTNGVPGVTAAKLFTPDTDTVAYTATTVTPGTNDASFFTLVFPDVADGNYRLVLFISTTVAAFDNVTVGDGTITIDNIDPSDPGKRTGYFVCYDEDGVVEPGVGVSCRCVYAPDTGLALDSAVRTEVSASDGLVQFTNLIVGAKYEFRRGVREWERITVEAGSGSLSLNSIVGEE